ncbi:MAG: hypothetical protein ACLP01_31400 [Solirubrobacteraceae bacterium]
MATKSARNRLLRAIRTTFPLLLTALAVAATAASASAAVSIHWHAPIRLESARNGGLSAVACTPTKLCVAVDTSGYAMTSTNPTGTTKVWSKPFRIDAVSGGSLTGISCPASNLCVAVDAVGDVVTSTNPTGGAKAWSKPARIDASTVTGGGFAGLAGVSCPTTTLCVAADSATPGNVLTSTNPTGGVSAWSMIKKVGTLLSSISCASITFCVAAGAEDYYSTNPGSAFGIWRATGTPTTTQTAAATFSAVDCPSSALCVDVGFGNTSTGLVSTATNPRGSAAAWTTVSVQPDPPNPGAGLFDGVGCFSSSYCIALDSADNVFISTTPATGVWGAQTEIEPLSTTAPTNSSIGCGPTVCVVVDSNGYAITGGERT